MPRGDGTGPQGMGPMTGRGAGYCAGYAAPGFVSGGGGGMGRGFGRGFGGGGFGRGFGRGRGMGWRNSYGAVAGPAYAPYPMAPFAPAQVTAKDEAALLRSQAAGIQQALEDINARLAELEKAEDTTKS